MTSQSPRIYTYKITFEEVPYYYYGVHKEKKYNEEYWGSPVANKWCWKLYTPKKQILEFFEFSDEGWNTANEVERSLIRHFFNDDKWCLNENCSGTMSLRQRSKAGKIGGQVGYKKAKELGVGIFALTKEQLSETAKKTAKKAKENKIGIFALTSQELSENGRKGGIKSSKRLNSEKWMCLETGMISTIGPLTRYQRVRGIDTSKKVKINN
jgi:hypothetical protein